MTTTAANFDNLYPALAECFAIILCGYLAGRMNLISQTEGKGINTFVGSFALPSLIFMSLAKLDLSSVNWLFLLSILIAKGLVFFAVIIITLLVNRPINLGRAGIFAIFCTQSNDFAIGYPIVEALYKGSHPEYVSYLYLMAPISLAILNPIAFIFMETGKQRSISGEPLVNADSSYQTSAHRLRLKLIVSVTKSIFFNPIIAMTILGIFGNIIFKHNVPSLLGEILTTLGSAFSASALFLLGLRMVGKVSQLRGATLIVPGILIMVKLLVLPLVIREVVSLLNVGGNSTETLDWTMYGFLYGTFPAAPTVFVFAMQFSLDIDLIASAMVACTFISAPLMFVSAKMITLSNSDPSQYIQQLDSFIFDISIGGTLTSVWLLFVFTLSKRICRVPHRITACLVFSQLMSCVGVIAWNLLSNRNDWLESLSVAVFTIGVYGSRIWTSFLAISLLLLQCRSLCYVLKLQPYFIAFGWGLPVIMSAVFVIIKQNMIVSFDKDNINFVYGAAQTVVAVSLLISCLVVTVGCLILHQRYRRRFARYLNLAQDVSSTFNQRDIESDVDEPTNVCTQPGCGNSGNAVCGGSNKCGLPTIREGASEDSVTSPVVDIEDLLNSTQTSNNDSTPLIDESLRIQRPLCSTTYGCESLQRTQCREIVDQYQRQIDDDIELIEEEPGSHDPQIQRHIVLLIMLCCSMFTGLALSVWTLIMERMSGIYIELSFIDATLNFGQSIIVFAFFGIDFKEVALPIVNGWKRLWFGANKLSLPAIQELNPETVGICEQFKTHHLVKCREQIAEDKRWRLKVYKQVFPGSKFVDWLIEVGLARDRIEAVHYARHLIEGRVLRHINDVYHFYDRHLLYTFY